MFWVRGLERRWLDTTRRSQREIRCSGFLGVHSGREVRTISERSLSGKLVTHSGRFHADDAFTAAMLRRIFPDATIERTRDRDRLKIAVNDADTIVFDVGDEYDVDRNTFDHHQVDFQEIRPNGVPYSSLGLCWHQYGARFVKVVLSAKLQEQLRDSSDLVERLDASIVLAIDATDAGMLEAIGRVRGHREHEIPLFNIGAIIELLNPVGGAAREEHDIAFESAVEIADAILGAIVRQEAANLIGAEVVQAADTGGPILELARHVPWCDHVAQHHRVCVHPASDGSQWMVEVVRDAGKPRVLFPVAWAGLRDSDLETASGIVGATFCHRARFLAGAKDREAAQAIAHAVLEEADQ